MSQYFNQALDSPPMAFPCGLYRVTERVVWEGPYHDAVVLDAVWRSHVAAVMSRAFEMLIDCAQDAELEDIFA